MSFESAVDDTIEAYARAVLPLLRDVVSRTDERFVLYGHSMGGLVAYECCRQLGAEVDDVVERLVLGACAPVWLGDPDELALPRSGGDRFNRHVRAVMRYRPETAPDPGVQVHILYSDSDVVIPPAASMLWAELGWKDVTAHHLVGVGHLFHTEAAARDAFVAEWGVLLATVGAGRNPRGEGA